ncbi:MAG: hypothetical protein IIB94_01215 [Candidatus Marinimicrobia bacterium]|nr:hypothetical protein [Candidatus Neomarinimicrobiota bacterium]
MSKSVVIKQNQGYFSMLPIGSIIAWHRDLLGAEKRLIGLPPGWVECNGQKIDDPESLYHNLNIPNLNADGRFLRGGKDSGVEQTDQMQNHTHKDKGHTHFRNPDHAPELAWRNIYPNGGWGVPGNKYDMLYNIVSVESSNARLGKPTVFRAEEPRIGSETRPVSMSVIWIMKIKQVTAVIPQPTILSHKDAPTGSLYINNEGNVGIGTSSPGAKLEVAGQVKITGGTPGEDKVLTSDAAGLAAWQTPSPGGDPSYGSSVDAPNDAVFVNDAGNVGIGTSNPRASLTVDSKGTDNTWNTAAFRKSALGPNWSHIHRGKTGDWYIRSAAKRGKVIIQDTGGNVGIGTNKPSAKLDVKGNIKAVNFEGDGSKLSNLNLKGYDQFNGKTLIPIHRFYHGGTGDHFYCKNRAEGDNAEGYKYEGIEFYAFW